MYADVTLFKIFSQWHWLRKDGGWIQIESWLENCCSLADGGQASFWKQPKCWTNLIVTSSTGYILHWGNKTAGRVKLDNPLPCLVQNIFSFPFFYLIQMKYCCNLTLGWLKGGETKSICIIFHKSQCSWLFVSKSLLQLKNFSRDNFG